MSIQSLGNCSVVATPGMALVGRTAEQATLDQLLIEARAGRSASLLLRGPEGIGKTALLQYAARRATGCRIVTALSTAPEN